MHHGIICIQKQRCKPCIMKSIRLTTAVCATLTLVLQLDLTTAMQW